MPEFEDLAAMACADGLVDASMEKDSVTLTEVVERARLQSETSDRDGYVA